MNVALLFVRDLVGTISRDSSQCSSLDVIQIHTLYKNYLILNFIILVLIIVISVFIIPIFIITTASPFTPRNKLKSFRSKA